MFYDVALVLFLLSLIIVARFVFRYFLTEKDETADTAGEKAVTDKQVVFTENHDYKPHKKNSSLFWPLAGFVAIIFLATQNPDAISSALSPIAKPSTAPADEQKRQTISAGNIYGHAVVDGVNWFKIVATSSEGVPFEGWINEMAIHASPPRENKAADALMQKLGLPTNKERIDSIKSLKKVGSALKDSLRSVRQSED